MDETRIRELVILHRVLAFAVTVLACTTGFLMAQRYGWLKTPVAPTASPTPVVVMPEATGSAILLPRPVVAGSVLNQALVNVSVERNFAAKPLPLPPVAELLWSMYGVNTDWGDRTVPSYKSTYPLRITVGVRGVEGLATGVYRYDPAAHVLRTVRSSTFANLSRVFGQPSVQTAPLLLVISADMYTYQNITKLEEVSLLFNEAGHVSQNAFLSASHLGLGTVEIAQLDQDQTKQLFEIPSNETVLLLLPVGIPEEKQ